MGSSTKTYLIRIGVKYPKIGWCPKEKILYYQNEETALFYLKYWSWSLKNDKDYFAIEDYYVLMEIHYSD